MDAVRAVVIVQVVLISGVLGFMYQVSDKENVFVDSLQQLCPLHNICNNKSAAELDQKYDELSKSGQTECCADCSCEDDCGLTQICCFPNRTVEVGQDQQYEECTFLSNKSGPTRRIHRLRTYRMVVRCPNQTQSDLEYSADVLFWEGMMPVFSRATKKIYQNEYVAKCHNIFSFTRFDLTVDCPDFLEGLYRDIKNSNIGTRCVANFFYPGPHSDLRKLECYTKVIDNCDPFYNFTVPSFLNMTESQVIEGCSSKLFAPYRVPTQVIIGLHGIYKNVYCSICNTNMITNRDPFGLCEIIDTVYDARESSGIQYLLDWTTVQKILTNQKSEPSTSPLACHTQNKIDCLEVVCPKLQLNMPGKGCQYIITKLSTKHVLVYIKLTTVHEKDQEFLTTNSIQYMDSLTSPWSESRWEIVRVFINEEGTSKYNEPFYAMVIVELSDINTYLQDVIEDVKTSLSATWLWGVNGEIIPFKQDFFEHPFLYKSLSLHVTDLQEVVAVYSEEFPMRDSVHLQHELKLMVKKEKFYDYAAMVIITRIHYCYQIRLHENQFHLFKSGILYSEKLKYVVFSNDFDVWTIGEADIVTCVENTFYEVVTNGSSALNSLSLLFVLLLTISSNVIGFDL